MKRYMVVVERGESSWGAHVPDLPGCVAVGETRSEVLRLIREAIEFHIAGLREDGLPVPEPSSEGEIVEVGAAWKVVEAPPPKRTALKPAGAERSDDRRRRPKRRYDKLYSFTTLSRVIFWRIRSGILPRFSSMCRFDSGHTQSGCG